MTDTPSGKRYRLGLPIFGKLTRAVCFKSHWWGSRTRSWKLSSACRLFALLVCTVLVAGCAAYGPYHANTSGEPFNSVRGPQDGRYKLAIIEFGDQGSMLDPAQLAAALKVIDK